MTSKVTNSFCCLVCLQYLPSSADSCFPSAQNPICYQYSCCFVRSVARIKAELSLPGTSIVMLRTLFVFSVLSSRELCVGENTAGDKSPNFVLFFPCTLHNKFAKLNQKMHSVSMFHRAKCIAATTPGLIVRILKLWF